MLKHELVNQKALVVLGLEENGCQLRDTCSIKHTVFRIFHRLCRQVIQSPT
jgi:hypothetical protein